MPRKLPKSVFDARRNDVWNDPRNSGSRRFMHRALRLTEGGNASTHFAGGESNRAGDRCPECKNRLTLLWDLDLRDPSFPDYVREGFAPATRLPFYICWQCCVASYSIPTDKKVACIKLDGAADKLEPGESPFGDAPEVLDRRQLAVTEVPSTVDALLSLVYVVGYEALDTNAKGILNEYLSVSVTSDWDMPFSQIGGTPLASQGHWNKVCPNRKCPASKIEHPYGDMQTKYLMKELGLIHWKEEPVLAEYYFELLYYVCTVCFSIRAEYRCS